MPWPVGQHVMAHATPVAAQELRWTFGRNEVNEKDVTLLRCLGQPSTLIS